MNDWSYTHGKEITNLNWHKLCINAAFNLSAVLSGTLMQRIISLTLNDRTRTISCSMKFSGLEDNSLPAVYSTPATAAAVSVCAFQPGVDPSLGAAHPNPQEILESECRGRPPA